MAKSLAEVLSDGAGDCIMRYPVLLEKDETGYVVRFPDVPEAVTWVEDLSDLPRIGLEALESALEFYAEDERPIPLPSSEGDVFIDLPLRVIAKKADA